MLEHNLGILFESKNQLFILQIKPQWRNEEYCDTISLSYAWIGISESKLASVKPYSLDVYITEIVQQLISIH